VLPALRGYSAIRSTLRYLAAQQRSDRFELVLVTPSVDALDVNKDEVRWCRHLRVVETRGMTSLGASFAAGARGATAPVVVFAEDHSFPQPGWAQSLLERHREPWAAVGPVVEHGNPGGPVSDASYYIAYGRWVPPASPGEIDDLPGHNSSYKREVLLECGTALDELMEAETSLHASLRAKGHRLYLEPAARVRHHNAASMRSLLTEVFYYGRIFAAVRAREWSAVRRTVYAAGSVLIPFVRLRRALRDIHRSRCLSRSLLSVSAVLAAALVVGAAGEMLGYALGAGASRYRFWRLECDRGLGTTT
jgi:GT2 family glycosyltransferase